MNRQHATTSDPSQAALHWLSRINEQPEQAHSAAFKRWLLADPAHRQAYAEAQALWQRSTGPATRLAEQEHDSLRPYLEAMAKPPARRAWRQCAGALAAAACLVLAVGTGAGWHPQYWLQDLQADYSSGDSLQQVTLADASQLTLDAGSAIAVDFDHGQRRVRLLRGAAFFHVTHTGAPFLVEAGGGEVRVLGTQFEVRELGAATHVTVRSGRVGVTPAEGQTMRELTADQQVAYAQGQAGDIQSVDSASRLAWRQGWLNYYQVPLAQVLDDLQRYYPGRIMLLDSALGQRKVSGSFPTGEPLQALDSLGQVLGFSRHTVLGRLTVIR
ncbi:DUF4974 domain-containing protein [Pseudomonas putida]|uniref:DUF4974 domain-containing protein n=1 Tax=Pseudomonas putida TaxID=303 RepID=A0A4D6X7Z3_PSEPU|nr:FecR domain-containing protein [Pseudomonas putida]QCI10801.1 DUF4974 domain-containing protein [Pseudomonas putida]